MTNYNIIKNTAITLITLIGLTSCLEKPEKVTESNVGANVLGFNLNGQYISYSQSGGFIYPLKNDVFANHYTESDKFTIVSYLDNMIWKCIEIEFSKNDIMVGETVTNSTFTLEYVYSITPDEDGDGSETEYKMMEDISGELTL